MQQPAIQAALDNLVEVIRTALTAEFLEYFRGGDTEPVRGKRAKAAPQTGKAKKKRPAKAAKAVKRAARPAK
jgi:hypothetical protein